MPQYVVESAERKNEFVNKYGKTMVVYTVALRDGEGTTVCELKQRPETPAPSEGQTLEGKIESSEYGFKFSKAAPASNGDGSYRRDPKESASIVRQHSQHMAIMWTAILQRDGKLKDDALTPEGLQRLTDWFMLDAGNGSERQPS